MGSTCSTSSTIQKLTVSQIIGSKTKNVCWCIGSNEYGSLCHGNTSTIQHNINKLHFNGHTKINSVVSGLLGSTYMNCDNELIVFGYNNEGQLGISDRFLNIVILHWTRQLELTHFPTDIVSAISPFFGANEPLMKLITNPIRVTAPAMKVKYISKGIASRHRFIITTSNEVYGAGRNQWNQLGFIEKNKKNVISNNQKTNNNSRDAQDNIIAHTSRDRSAWTKIDFFSAHKQVKIKQIHCSWIHSIFLSENGNIFCVGKSMKGSLGLGHSVTHCNEVKRIKKIYDKIVHIDGGEDHILALTKQGTVYSWGSGDFGQTGHYKSVTTWTPTIIGFFLNEMEGDDGGGDGSGGGASASTMNLFHNAPIVKISCGHSHSMVLDKDGNVYCFGWNKYHQCGDIGTQSVEIPVILLRNEHIRDIKCGGFHNVVETVENEYYLWGHNNFNQCLVFDDTHSECVEHPTKYKKQSFGPDIQRIASIFPGFRGTKIVCTSD